MTLFRILVLASLGLGAFLRSASSAEFFVRPALWYADYDASGFDSKIGAAIEAGSYLGATSRHALSVEAASVAWALGRPQPATLGTFGDGHITPVLASYRYEFRARAARWGVYVGASAGATKVSGRLETQLSGVAYVGDVSTWAATWVGTIGGSATLTQAISVDLAFRYLYLDDVEYSTRLFAGVGGFTGGAGPARSFPATQAGIIYLGLTFRF